MTDIRYREGDATVPIADGVRIICHVCNDVGGWGRGFVLALSKRWSAPEAQYREWFRSGPSGGFRLGAVDLVQVEQDIFVANMIAQRGTHPAGGLPPIRYDALRSCLAALARHANQLEASVHMPRIGCGLAGGSWPEVESLIQSTLVAANVPVCVYDF